MKRINPAVSAYMSDLAKKNKNPHRYTSETAKRANEIAQAKRKLAIENLQHEANTKPQEPESN